MIREDEESQIHLMFAGIAMHGLLTSQFKYENLSDYATKAFRLADEMIKKAKETTNG